MITLCLWNFCSQTSRVDFQWFLIKVWSHALQLLVFESGLQDQNKINSLHFLNTYAATEAYSPNSWYYEPHSSYCNRHNENIKCFLLEKSFISMKLWSEFEKGVSTTRFLLCSKTKSRILFILVASLTSCFKELLSQNLNGLIWFLYLEISLHVIVSFHLGIADFQITLSFVSCFNYRLTSLTQFSNISRGSDILFTCKCFFEHFKCFFFFWNFNITVVQQSFS